MRERTTPEPSRKTPTIRRAYPNTTSRVSSSRTSRTGNNAKAAKIAGDLIEQSTRVMNAAEAYGRFTPISEADLFDMEYWSLEQAKLKSA